MQATAGIGLRSQHIAQVLADGCTADFFEVHAENYMVAGGPCLAWLARIRDRWPLSIHGVGLSLGGIAPPDAKHLDRLSRLLARFEPEWFSEHLAWSSHGGIHYNDLLPVPYDEANLRRVCSHVDEVQMRLGRRMLLENPSTYLEYERSTMTEPAFIAEVVRRTGCGLLLDVNNVYVSCRNNHWDELAYLEALPLTAVEEIHLAGFTADATMPDDPLLIDTHGAPVDAAVWALYRATIELTGAKPTLIERDRDVPPLSPLEQEAEMARDIQNDVTRNRLRLALA